MTIKELKAIVDQQAEDEGLWFRAQHMSEAYLQKELRKLHAAIEALDRGKAERCMHDVHGTDCYQCYPLDGGTHKINPTCCKHGISDCSHVCHRLGSSYCDSCCSCEPDGGKA